MLLQYFQVVFYDCISIGRWISPFYPFRLWAFSAEKEEWRILLFRMSCIRYNVSRSETASRSFGTVPVVARVSVCYLRKGWSWKDSELCTLCVVSPHLQTVCCAELSSSRDTFTKMETPPSASCYRRLWGLRMCHIGMGHWFPYLFTWYFSQT